MNVHRPVTHIPIGSVEESTERFACVDYERSYLRTPLNWRLRLWGQSVGGYGILNGSTHRYADKIRAEEAARVWLEAGVTPAFQTVSQPFGLSRSV